MTSHLGRLYAVTLALVVFFLAWAVVAARPWAAASADPRLRSLAIRQAELQRESTLVRKIVTARWASYRVELRARRAEIARVNAAAAAAAAQAAQAAQTAQAATVTPAPAAAAPVQVVNLPPAHVVTRTS